LLAILLVPAIQVFNSETVVIITPKIVEDPRAASEFTEEKN
jgi:type II secretory pathway component GspD/PulD (secretin)